MAMANTLRGETALTYGGRTQRLSLTLGALAELEAEIADGGLAALAARLAGGKLSLKDTLCILAAGMRGAGQVTDAAALGREITAADLGAARQAAIELLVASFGGGASSPPPPPQAD